MSLERRSDWLTRHSDRAGPLLSASQRFLSKRQYSLQAGAAGIHWLAKELEAYCYTESELSADECIEGLGASLGLLLIERFPEAKHASHDSKHRIRLGHYGTFDPFRAIEACLEAEDPLEEFTQQLETAEAEHKDRGPTATLVRLFKEELADTHPELTIQSIFELELILNDATQVDLGRIAQFDSRASTEEIKQALNKIISLLPGGTEPASTSWRELKEQLYPRLIPNSFIEEIAQRSKGEKLLWAKPISSHVQAALVLAYPGRMRFVRKSEAQFWDEDRELFQQALDNLSAKSISLKFFPLSEDEHRVFMINHRDGFDASRALLPDLHTRLAPKLGDEIACAVPHRDALLICSDTRESRTRLKAYAEDAALRAPHRISEKVFSLRDLALSLSKDQESMQLSEIPRSVTVPAAPRAKT